MFKMEIILVASLLFAFADGVEYSRLAEGVPQGFIPDCPGSSKPAVLRPESLKKLTVSVVGKDGSFTGSYTFKGMEKLANNPDIDFRKKTILYVGGYLDSTSWQSGKILAQAYKRNGYNALTLETLEFTATYYPHAARHMRPIGELVAKMLVKLRTYGLDPKKLELVGISLGAHTMGFIAKNYQQMTGQNISSITAMDPAGPCFRNLGPAERLDTSDADFVLGIITNMYGSGIAIPIGHVVFIVNGGEFQNGHYDWIPCDTVCSHVRSYFLWWSALMNPGTFLGLRCDHMQQAKDGSCYDIKPRVINSMDLHTDRSKTGIYSLRTSNRWPFALGKMGLRRPRVDMSNNAPRRMEVVDVLKYIYS